MADVTIPISGWRRALMAGEEVRERACRAAKALGDANVPYAVVGGNAVAEWVGRVEKGAVRFTRDVDILIRRGDLDAAKKAMAADGWVHAVVFDVEMFLDGPSGLPKDAVHLLFAGEKVRGDDIIPSPDVGDSEPGTEFQVLSLESLVRMKLTSWRLKDRVHVQDMIGVGLVNQSWTSRLPSELVIRLQELLDNPNG
jgi:hypothetical protein